MDKLEQLLRKFVSLRQDAILKRIYREFVVEQFILELNRQKQLYELGEDSVGESLGQYSPFTIQMKLAGDGDKRIDHVTLKDTGEFYESFKLKPLADGFEILANAIKDDDDLTDIYGDEIIGLSEKSKTILSAFLLPFIQEEVRKKLL